MPSRRRNAPNVPASLHRSASASNRRFSLPENWRRLAIATTSGSRRAASGETVSPVALRARRVSTEDYSSVLLTEPDMRARIRLFGLIDQNASESWLDTCGWLISFQRSVSEAIRPVNQDGG